MFRNLVQTMDTASKYQHTKLGGRQESEVHGAISQDTPPQATNELVTSVSVFKKCS
jgi:hypothetical protein